MTSHKQSFQCFDTLTDDPSLKPLFPHGHCSATSFRGSSGSTRLEDRGCYLCADHQQAKTMASEASGAYDNPWYHFQTHPHTRQCTNRRPFRPEEAPGQSEDHHHHHRHSRKIVLVKNSDPSVRRTIVLHRRSLRSLPLFMDEVSELMHCLIRKLYTLQGHKIDSVQSLLQCPSILVCVGREPFHPLLLDGFRKNSYDKLPRLNIKSRSSVCSDEKGAKKNVNFGLETKRSTIHPRCDSSNRSARLSVSSEKLFPSGLHSLPPGHRGDCPHTGENMMDDDIEKRVLVNQDGSLSMEMKVRFRLLHNETLHWSTEVKKSKSSFNDSQIVPDDACTLSHGSAESCSEGDSLSAGEADETYSTKCFQRHFEDPHCKHCCAHCQEYDIWKNPVPPSQKSVRRIRSSSSSASSRRIVRKKASTDSMHTMSSEEYTEHVVEKATCIQQTIGQQGNTTIEQCTINHCCSRSEMRSVSPKTKSTSATEDKCENTQTSDNDENRPDVISSNLPKDQLSVQINQPVEEDERPVSVVSCSSQILASLKEDQDDEDVEYLPVSISRASRGQQEDAEPNPCSVTPCKSPASLVHLSPRPPSKASSSGQSKKSRKFASPEVGDEEVRSEASALSGPKTYKCEVSKDIVTPGASESNDQLEDIDVQDTETEERALSAMSAKSNISTKSLSELSASCENAPENTAVNDEIIEERSSSAISVKSNTSGKSNKTNVSEVLEQQGRACSAMSVKSHRSDKSRKTEISQEQNSEVRTSSAMSAESNTSVRSRLSEHCFDELAKSQDSVEERATSALSSKSNISAKSSQSKEPQSAPDGASEERIEEKASSVTSGTSNNSGIEELTNDNQTEDRVHSSISMKSKISARSEMSIELSELEDYEQDRAPSSVSIKSNVSQKSKSDISEVASLQEGGECLNEPGERSASSMSSISNISKISRTSKISEAVQDEAQEKEDVLERAPSTISVKSTTSARSRKSKTTPTPASAEEMKVRAPSVMSIKSNASLKSNKSKMEEEETENRASSALSVKSVSTLSKKSHVSNGEQLEERASSAISAKSNVSVRSKGSKMSEVAGDDDGSSEVYAASHTSETSNECRTAPEETCESTEKSPDKEERAPSALSAKSNRSSKSKKSRVSDMAPDLVADDIDDLRSASVLSSKSNISARSVKTMVSETRDETEESNQSDGVEVAEERALSAMSSKSSASGRLKKSNNLNVPFASPRGAEQQTEDRAESALSTRSSVSTRSNKSRISDVLTDKLVDAKDQEEERASSAMSAKSNISAKSKKSNASATNVNTDNKEKGDRVISAMSGRSDISTKTSISAKSKTSKVSEIQAEEPDAKGDEERASSAMSAKSNISAKSKKSNAPATDGNTDNEEKEDRVPSAMSGRSDISNKTSISTKSKASKVPEIQAEEPDDEESEVKTPSITKSSISVRSNKSKHSEKEEVQSLGRPPSSISIMSEVTPDENDISNEGEIQERAPSAVSGKSNSSARSRTSKISERDEPDKRAPSSRSLKSGVSGRSGLEDQTNEDEQMEARTESALSSISNVSARSNKDSELISNVKERAPSTASATSKTSARSKRSNISGVAPKETVNTDTGEVRSASAMSAKSCASEKAKHSERTAKEDEEANNVVERTTSSLSVKSTPSTTSGASVKSSVVPNKSNASAVSLLSEAEEPNRRSTSVVSNASAESEVSKAGVDKKANRSPSKLSVKSNISTRSRKSKVSEGQVETATNTADIELNRDESPVSDRSTVSQAENSNKYVCGAINKSSCQMGSSENDSEHEEVPASPLSKKSAKSKISSVSSSSERVLTPTSTSVSIGIVEDHEADDVEEVDECAVSMISDTSASSKTEICGKSDQCLSESPVQITSETTQTPEKRPKSFASAKSNVSSKSKSKCSHCSSTFPRDTIQDRDDVASNKSSKTNHLNTSSDSQPSGSGSVRQSSPNEEIRPSSKASARSMHTEITGQENTESPDATHKSQSVCSKCSSTQQKTQISSASAISDSEKSKTKEGNTAEMIDRPKSNISSSSSHLKVNNQKKTTVVNGRNNKLSTKSTQNVEDNTPQCHSVTLSVTSGNQLSPIPPKSPKKSKKTAILLGGSNDSMLSQTIPAPAPRDEHTYHLNAAAENSQSCRSDKNISDIKSEKSSKCRKRFGSDSSCHKMDEDMSELSPSCLPNASPTEVVNEWLRKIPSDAALCDLGDEFHDNFDLIEPLCISHVPSGIENEHDALQHDVTKLETQHEMADAHVVKAEGAIDKKSPKVAEGDHSQRGDEPKIINSSVLVMKVLLSSKLDRCNSLPEVSPVYGRKLSTSAQGLLDCLANLQLLDFGSSEKDGNKEKYQELMSMLKSLWLCDPKDSEKTSEERNKHLDKELKARSSSGVDVNSGSTGSGKSSVNDGTQVQINTECEGLDSLTKVQEVDEIVEEEASETPVSKYDSATPDIASQAPEKMDTVEGRLKDDAQSSDETIRNNDSPRDLIETPLSNKSSGNNNKETESDRQEDTSSGSAPTQQRSQLSKRLSQDPDPVWILNLLNKLEKQFMTHYVNAMTEFKVRWNLDDNEQLDSMISELQDEVRKRIQLSIDRELRKIQGRAGRPRPPKETMSRESTIQTEQRRRRLKVMRNQSIDPQPAKSDDEYTMTGTDFSDQRSDDEYCPCDTCLKKKMASKQVLPVEMLNSAPVMMEFDLRKILQMKKSSPTNENTGEVASESTTSKMEGEIVGLEAVKEEDEKEGADFLASSAQEIKEEYEKRESEESEEEDNASSTYVEDGSVKQSNISEHLRKDVNEIGEIAEMSDDTITAQHKEAEQDEEQEENDETDSDLMAVKESASSFKINDELDEDVANDDISEFDDIIQVETAKEATVEYIEEESKEQDETAHVETAEEGQTEKRESVEECETTGEETVEKRQTAEVLSVDEDDTAGNETAEEGETGEGETVEEGETAEDETLEDGQTPEAETAREDKITEDETGEEGATVNDDTAEEDETAENETAEDGQTAEDETGEEGETVNDDSAEVREVAENEIAEDRQTTEDETAEDGQTTEDETGEENETINDTEEEDEVTENEIAEDRQTTEDEIADEDDTAENETAEDGQTAEDETGEEGETINDTAEEDEVTENETAEDGQTAEYETGEEGATVNDDTAEEDEAVENKTAEDETGEGQTVHDDTAEEDEVVENETAEDGQTAEDESGEEGEAVNDTAEEDEVTENEIAKDGQTAEDETGEEGETNNDDTAEEDEAVENETAEDETGEGQTVHDDTAEEDETAEKETAEDGQTTEDETREESETGNNDTTEVHEAAENETGEEGDTINNDTEEEHETAENESAGQTAEEETGEEVEKGNDDTAEEAPEHEAAEDDDDTAEEHEAPENKAPEDGSAEDVETADDKTSEDGRTTGVETAGEDESSANNESVEDANTGDNETAEEGEIANDDTVKECEMAENESVEAESETAGETDSGDEDAADEGTTEAETEEKSTFEDGPTAEDKSAEVELAERKQTPDHETTGEETEKSQSDVEEDNESVSCDGAEEGNIVSNLEDTECLDVLTNLEVVEDETPLKNKGDVVLDSVDEGEGEESEKEDDVEVIANKGGLVANNGESAEAGDEAEEDTEPDMETDEVERDGNAPALQPVLQPKQIHDKPNEETSFNVLVKHNPESEDGADADGEDSETEEHNQVVDFCSESEDQPQTKTAQKTFKMLVHTLNFLKLSSAGQPGRKEEENEHEVEGEGEETPEDGSDDAEESSCVEKDEVEELNTKKDKLSDITEDTAEEEEHQTSEINDDSKDSDWESSEDALQKQMTKSSMESQPGSFEEVHEELTKNQKGSNHLKANWQNHS